ncbi:FeoB-associated Cys-rich membrane protein [Bacillus sp. C1]
MERHRKDSKEKKCEHKNCSHCGKNPCCCSHENNSTNTFNPVITVNPVFNIPPTQASETRYVLTKKTEGIRIPEQNEFIPIISLPITVEGTTIVKLESTVALDIRGTSPFSYRALFRLERDSNLVVNFSETDNSILEQNVGDSINLTHSFNWFDIVGPGAHTYTLFIFIVSNIELASITTDERTLQATLIPPSSGIIIP